MENNPEKNSAEILKLLPSIDTLLRSETSAKLVGKIGTKHLAGLARLVTDSLRQEIQNEIADGKQIKTENYSREILLKEAESRLENSWRQEQNTGLQRVINAGGVIIHTNLGRSTLSEAARIAMLDASGYCNLEYDIETGKRGKRGARAENLLAELSGAESALIVNNCAAACVLVLSTLCKGGEAIVSRGELVEIGGDFRVPDVMIQSGAELVEVGTTNKTRAADYENAITENTKLITKVHPSNYRIIGFTSTPGVAELAEIAKRNGVLLYEDAGSGAMFDMSEYGLTDEPIIPDSIKNGADVVTFSGDKLLGGIQSGLIVGRKNVIEKLRKNPLYRALRVSKIIYAVLEKTLEEFRKETAVENIPTLKMLSMTTAELKERTEKFAQNLREKLSDETDLEFEVMEGESVIGGGSAPAVHPKTTLLVLKHKKSSASQLEEKLRHSKLPVIVRIVEDRVVIDLRTVLENEEAELLEVLSSIKED
ncbi:MAG: L-seryl-tRNA(Sec) selenium transferase [Acidobacteriota bacterium]|nr:L-seryl-tRNA(Sec) selenium transferase [Acidobacteriota bacterium]